jgi:tight adherence protein C
MILFIVLIAVAAVLLGSWSVSTAIESRQNVQRSMDAMAGYGAPETARSQEMMETVGDRLLAPIADGALKLGRYFTKAGYEESIKRKIVLAGNPPGFELDRFIVSKVLLTGLAAAAFFVVFLVFGASGWIWWLLLACVAVIAFFAPDLILQRKIDDRRTEIERQLPDTLDLLVISVEAGLGFEQAVDRTAMSVPGALSEELRRMLQETRMGASRADALRALDERTQVEDLRTFILAMLQADSFGISVARILRSQAEETRIRRRQHAQERAQKAPVKMLFPLAFFIFPAIFVVVLLPALISITDSLGSGGG